MLGKLLVAYQVASGSGEIRVNRARGTQIVAPNAVLRAVMMPADNARQRMINGMCKTPDLSLHVAFFVVKKAPTPTQNHKPHTWLVIR